MTQNTKWPNDQTCFQMTKNTKLPCDLSFLKSPAILKWPNSLKNRYSSHDITWNDPKHQMTKWLHTFPANVTKWLEMPNYQVTFPFQKLQSFWNDQMTLRNSMTHQYSTHEDHFEWPKTPNDQITIHFPFKWLQIPNYHMKFPFRNLYLKVT